MRWGILGFVLMLAGCEDPEREKIKEIPTGYKGQARINPYLAAERYLNEQGWVASSSRTWANFDDETGVIFVPSSFLETRGMGIRVLDWVAEGGTLVVMAAGGEPERNDFTDDATAEPPAEGENSGWDYLLAELGLEIREGDWEDFVDDEVELKEYGHLSRPWHVTKLEDDRGGYHLELEGPVGIYSEYDRSWDAVVDGVSRVLGVSYGGGEVLVISHARPFRSPYLGRADHAEFLEGLADAFGPGEVVFLYGSSNSFFGLIWKEGYMVVIAGLILLGCWLWMRVPRFGPVLEDSFKKPRPYGDELTASARFLWRRGQVEHLLGPLRAKLERENEGNPETLCERLAEDSDLKRDEVAEALAIAPLNDPGQILKVVRKLQTLLKR